MLWRKQGVPGQGLSESVRKYRQSVFKLNYKIKKHKSGAAVKDLIPTATSSAMPVIPATAAARVAGPNMSSPLSGGSPEQYTVPNQSVSHTPAICCPGLGLVQQGSCDHSMEACKGDLAPDCNGTGARMREMEMLGCTPPEGAAKSASQSEGARPVAARVAEQLLLGQHTH